LEKRATYIFYVIEEISTRISKNLKSAKQTNLFCAVFSSKLVSPKDYFLDLERPLATTNYEIKP